jgi:hypothetical protein
MSQLPPTRLESYLEQRRYAKPGDLWTGEIWWVERQEALERAGYMLRPGWHPPWMQHGTNKPHFYFKEGQTMSVSDHSPFSPCPIPYLSFQWLRCMGAIRISDGKPVMMKLPLSEKGPYNELEVNKLFSTGPLASNPRNHCVQLLDVIELPGDPPILVEPMLRPFDYPPIQTYGEFVSFFSQICEVSFA